MSTTTHIAHCGACGGRMWMHTGIAGIWFVCVECWEETPPRMTAAEADDDVVWVPVTVPAAKSQLANGGRP